MGILPLMQPQKKDPTPNPPSLAVSHGVLDKIIFEGGFNPACYSGRVIAILYFLSLLILPFFLTSTRSCLAPSRVAVCGAWHGWEVQPGPKLFDQKTKQQV